MPKITFRVDGDPKPQPRPRAGVRKIFKGGQAQFVVRSYDAATAEGWKSFIAEVVRNVRPALPLAGPVSVALRFFIRRPQNLCRAKDPLGLIPHTSSGDVDNFAKAVLDVMTQLGFWRDDKQVYLLHVEKYFSEKNGRAGMEAQVCWNDKAETLVHKRELAAAAF